MNKILLGLWRTLNHGHIWFDPKLNKTINYLEGISKDFLLELKVHDVQMYFVIGYFQTNIK